MSIQSLTIVRTGMYGFERPLLLKLQLLEKMLQHERQQQFAEAFSALTQVLLVKDAQLYRHSYRVQYFTHYLTYALNLSKDELMTVELAALFHDIGKIGISDKVLHKASYLTRMEFEHVKEHPIRGALLLSQLSAWGKVATLVQHHHERWDGHGYPNGLRGEAIPLGARIVAIADAFEVMTSPDRTYQTTRTPLQALEELLRSAGSHFDPVLVNYFSARLGPGAGIHAESSAISDHNTPARQPLQSRPHAQD